MTDHNDNLLDGCLQEFLSGTGPPDLTARILKAYDSSRDILDAPLEEILGGITPPKISERVVRASAAVVSGETRQPVEPFVGAVPRPASKAKPRRHSYRAWASVALALAAVVCGAVIGWDAWQKAISGDALPEIAQEDDIFGPPPSPSDPSPSDFAVVPIEEPQTTPPLSVESVPIPESVIQHRLQLRNPQRLASQSIEPVEDTSRDVSEPRDRQPLSPQPKSQIVQTVNASIQRSWESAGISPAASLADRPWCNRVYEKLLGRPAEHYELATFVGDKSPDKRARLVDRLLRDEWYTEDFAGHWGNVWSDVLLATATKNTNRDGLAQFLRRSFADGDSFDRVSTLR